MCGDLNFCVHKSQAKFLASKWAYRWYVMWLCERNRLPQTSHIYLRMSLRWKETNIEIRIFFYPKMCWLALSALPYDNECGKLNLVCFWNSFRTNHTWPDDSLCDPACGSRNSLFRWMFLDNADTCNGQVQHAIQFFFWLILLFTELV